MEVSVVDASEFREDLIQEARASAASDGEGTSAAYVNNVAAMLMEAEVLPAFDRAFYLGSGYRQRRLRVDGYVVDDFDNSVSLVVANFSGEADPPVLTRSEASQIFEWPLRFVEEVYHRDLKMRLDVSTPAHDLADTLLQMRKEIRKFRILLITDRFISDRIESFPAVDFDGRIVEHQIWDPERLLRVCGVDAGREPIEIDFTEYGLAGIPCLESVHVDDGRIRSFLGIIPGHVIADIYEKFGSRLLEGNVRSFLSTKGAVNKKIRETVLNKPEMFFVYNNGIAATATTIDFATINGVKHIARVRDFQIINGGQTTASLSNARYKDRADLSQIRVQMKLTEINAEEDEATGIVQAISRSSNSQNKVSDADFFSTHPFHVRIEQISRRVYASAVGGAQHDTHWFYERARGQYLQAQMRMTKSERDKFTLQNPKKQLVTKTDLAKVRNSWRGRPHVVSKGAQANFADFAQWVDDQWSVSPEQFHEQYFQESIALYILFKHVEVVVSNEPWYQQGYRANIVTYTIAWLSYLIEKQYSGQSLDLRNIWLRQAVPDVLTEELRKLARHVFDSITSPDRGTVNVTQWCKQELCWTRVRKIPLELDPRIATVLIGRDEVKKENREAQQDQKLVSGLEAQTRVLELGPDYWTKLRGYVSQRGIATEAEMKSLSIACQIPSKLPNSVQSANVLTVLARARSEGWKD